MKKFKNKWSLDVKGTPSLIEAFTKEVEKLGYTIALNREVPVQMTSYNDHQDSLGFFKQWENSNENGCRTSQYFKEINLPFDWDLGLKLAAEAEEEIVKPEVGEWYRLSYYPDSIFHCSSVNEIGAIYGYGFDKDGNWGNYTDQNNSCYCMCNEVAFKYAKLATDQEVQDALLNFANTHYPIGTRFKSPDDNGVSRLVTPWDREKTCTYEAYKAYKDCKNWVVRSDNGIGGGSGCSNPAIFKHGKWAEILPNEVKVNGYVVERVNSERIKVGCKKFTIKELRSLYQFLNDNGGTYSYDSIDWDMNDIQKVIDEFNKM